MKRTLIAFALLAALPLGAAAADLDYTYIEGGYAELDLDGGSDPDGWSVGGSAALGENFHIFGSFGSFDYDVGPLDLDADRWRIGPPRGGAGYTNTQSFRGHGTGTGNGAGRSMDGAALCGTAFGGFCSAMVGGRTPCRRPYAPRHSGRR